MTRREVRADHAAVAVLFVRSDSVYKTMPGVDCWDAERNALLWPGGCPCVCHPPCRTWGKLRRFATRAPATEHAMGLWAMQQVRTWGGVLEHPEGSRLFSESGCNPAGGFPDQYGGRTILVDQWLWGHRARKRTLIYYVGTQTIPEIPHRTGKPTHVVSSGFGVRSRPSNSHRSALPEIEKWEREATPPEFAEWLVEVARRCVLVIEVQQLGDGQ